MSALDSQRLVVVDLECTCWKGDPPPGMVPEIIEIGLCVFNAKKDQIERSEGFFVRPKYSEVSEFCTRLTGITAEQLQRENYFPEVLNRIKKKYPLSSCAWASWSVWDRQQMEQECLWKGAEYPFRGNHVDLNLLFNLFFGVRKNVADALSHLGLSFEGREHSGKDDALNEARILQAIVRKLRQFGR